MAKYDFWVQTYEIKPPIDDKIGWGAKANVKEIGTSDEAVTLHEHWGTTKEEAAAKADEEAKEWIAERGSSES